MQVLIFMILMSNFQIGYLRDGHMLVQDSPKALLEKYGIEFSTSILDVFCIVDKNPPLRTNLTLMYLTIPGPNSKLNATTLDDVMFYFCKTHKQIITQHCIPKMCKMKNDLDRKVQLLKVGVVEADISNTKPIQPISPSKISNLSEHSKNYYSQVKALTVRNWIVFTRYPL